MATERLSHWVSLNMKTVSLPLFFIDLSQGDDTSAAQDLAESPVDTDTAHATEVRLHQQHKAELTSTQTGRTRLTAKIWWL